jgi:TrmH family RNA methyltransferase
VLTERSPRIAAAHRLLRRSRRTETGEFLAEGAPAVTEAIAYAREHPGEVLELFITEAAAAKHVRLVRAAFAAKVEVTQVTEKAAAALSDAITPQGIVVRCAHPSTGVADVLAGSPKLVVVLVRANDPGNAGTVIRLADAAGADGVILAGDSVDAFNPKAIRASAGSLFHLPVARAADESALLDELSAAGLSVLATTGAAELDLDAASADGILDLPTAWLFGSEAHGLPDDVVARADEAVRVPIYGRAESLNLASAAAICLYASAAAQRRAAARSSS